MIARFAAHPAELIGSGRRAVGKIPVERPGRALSGAPVRVYRARSVARLAIVLASVVLALGCKAPTAGKHSSSDVAPAPPAPSAEVPAAHKADSERADDNAERARCQAAIARARGEPSLPGALVSGKLRADVLARAKSDPVLFVRAPRSDSETSLEAQVLSRDLARSPSPAYTLHKLYGHFEHRPELARSVLLREGYLYADSPAMASALVDAVQLRDLFRAPELVIQRGSRLYRVVKSHGYWYEYADGPRQGQRARLLLFDRVWVKGHPPGPPLHVDVEAVAKRQGFTRMRVERITADAIVAQLRYGGSWVPAVLRTHGATASLDCELPPPGRAEQVHAARDNALGHGRVVAAERRAIDQLVAERLPFDEPKTEIGQQDGNLRPAWRWAYKLGMTLYEFNDDHYRVFDWDGRPIPPEVCIDFITDTLERASGTWWRSEGNTRERVEGGLDFDLLGIDNRHSVERFIRFASEHPEWFDVYDLAEDERPAFLHRDDFYAQIYAHRDRYVPGDIVAIYGPRSDGKMHYHSFYVVRSDPVTGMPILLAGNSGHPRVRAWDNVMRNAPLRSIKTRIRPRLEWLEQHLLLPHAVSALEPAAPSPKPGSRGS